VGIASWFVNASAIHTSALAIEPGITRDVSLPVTDFVRTLSEQLGVGSVENVVDRLRNRDRDGISLVAETIATDEAEDIVAPTPLPELEVPVVIDRPGDGLLLHSIPVLNADDYLPEKVGRTIRVLVTGDSLSTFAGQELVKLLASDERFVVRIEWANGSGLTKPNVLDWGQYARDLTTRFQPDLVIVILGGNDTVSMVNAGELVDRTTEEWVIEYSRRIQLVTNEFAANKVTNVVWAGPPPVANKNRNLSYSQIHQSLLQVNEQNPTFRYLDNFTNIEPILATKVSGERIPLRQADGVHWTRDASKLIADELNQMLLSLRP
jgi:lysophospholipase L1-like esterase